MSSGSPFLQASKDGEASSVLSDVISFWRSLRGNAVSSGSAPILSKGGSATSPISDSRLKPFPARQPCSIRLARKTAGGDCSGSASTFTSVKRPDTIDWISSRRSSSAASHEPFGASSDCSTLSATPALEPGV